MASPSATRVYGRWKQELSLSIPHHLLPVPVHAYDAPRPFPPHLHTGDRVQLIALSPSVYRTLNLPPGQNIYDVYDPQIIGRVAAMKKVEPERLVVLVENERGEHGVAWAVVSAPFRPGKETETLEEEVVEEWMKNLLDSDRCMVQWGLFEVVVADDIAEGVTPAVECRYPDPKTCRRDMKITDELGAWKPHHQL